MTMWKEKFNIYPRLMIRGNDMNNRLFFRWAIASLLIIIGLAVLGCNLVIPNEIRNPEELFAKKGGMLIHNMSTTKKIQKFTITNDSTGEEVPASDIGWLQGSGDDPIIGVNEARGVVLDPGTYTVEVEYPSDAIMQDPKKITVEWKQTVELYFGTEGVYEPYGILQVLNFSNKKVVSVKLGSKELLPDDAPFIEDRGIFAKSLATGSFIGIVQLEDQPAFDEEPIPIRAGEVTNVVVTADGIKVGVPELIGKNNNLWIMNRITKNVTGTKAKRGEEAFASFGDPPTIQAGGHRGDRLLPGTYEIQATIADRAEPLSKSGIVLTNYDPVFIVVQLNAQGEPELEVITPGDQDEDGFPDWWERENFGDEAVKDPNVPPRDGDEDGDGVTNWDEYERGTNPKQIDSDGDGLTDGEEIEGVIKDGVSRPPNFPALKPGTTFEPTNPLNPDSDKDGYGDQIELSSGSDPNDSNSIPTGGLKITVNWGSSSSQP
jgi:hypothetical protein